MRLKLAMIGVALTLTGCTTMQERLTANNHIATEPYVYNQMVLDNLADIMENPATLPYFATLDSGIPQVADSGSFGGFWMFPAQTVVKQLHNQHGGQVGPLTASRSIQANWTLKPVNDDNRLRAMRCLYLWVLGHREVYSKDCLDRLKMYFPLDAQGNSLFDLTCVPTGWFKCGPWHAKPKDACYYVNRHLKTYWVNPAHEEDFTKFTLTIIRIALQAQRTMTVKINTYDKDGNRLREETRVTAYVPLPSEVSASEVAAMVRPLIPGLAVKVARAKAKAAHASRPPVVNIAAVDIPRIPFSLDAIGEEVRNKIKDLPADYSLEEIKAALEDGELPTKTDSIINANNNPIKPLIASPNLFFEAEILPDLKKEIDAKGAAMAARLKSERAALNALPDPELKIDTFSNPEISPGLVTLPH